MTPTNEFGQPVGLPLGGWAPPDFPPAHALRGRTVELVPLDPGSQAAELFDAFTEAPDSLWTYMAFGPFDGVEDLETTLESLVANDDWLPYAIVVDGLALGFASYLRIQPRDGVIEIGSITFSPAIQRTTAATEAIYLMIRNAFDLGYRRCEWKCDDLNEPSRLAADRLGFTYEGTFRQATHYKGRNRDTAWYAITDREWPAHDEAFQQWLAPGNFDGDGRQRKTLREIRESHGDLG
jgi:RimJ/RimL family protein N-acetyltransferase